jgi:Glycosyltransferase family 87
MDTVLGLQTWTVSCNIFSTGLDPMSLTFKGKQILAPILALSAAASMWFYVRRILVPRQVTEGARLERPRGNLSDLYPRWLGARELLLHGRDPYSPEITREIQRGYYGRELDSSRPNDPKDQSSFAYPVYVVFLLAPTVFMSFSSVKILSFWVLTFCAVLSVLLWERLLNIPFSRWRTMTTVVLLLGSYPFIEAVSLQQPILLVALLLAGSCVARQGGWLVVSGVLLALATIKPQVAFLPVIVMLLWVLGDWRTRQRWLWGFAAMMLTLLAAGEFVLPGWSSRFYKAVHFYQIYMANTSFLDWLVTPRLSSMVWVLIVLLIGRIAWKVRALSPNSPDARRAFCLALVAVVCTSPNLALYNQILLLPGVLLWIERAENAQLRGVLTRFLTKLLAALVTWPWFACVVLIGARVFLGAEGFVQRAWQIPHYAALPLPVVLLILLLLLPWVTVTSRRTSPPAEILP